MLKPEFVLRQKNRLLRRENKYRLLILQDLFSNQAVSLSAELRIKNALPYIKKALLKIDNGTYGFCDICRKSIPKKRLELVPGAIYCLNCQRKMEK